MQYDNWTVPSLSELHFEWETEWDKMRYYLETEYFDDSNRMVSLIAKYGTPVRISRTIDQRLSRRTHCSSIEELEATVASYRSAARRKGVPVKLAEMMANGEALPMPIIMKNRGRLYVVSGNTRLDVAEILDIHPDPLALYVDLDNPQIAELIDQYPMKRFA